jgi:hypothetical protein
VLPVPARVISTRISDDDSELLSALEQVVGCGHGAVISCIPGRLGYFEGEWKERFILENATRSLMINRD